VLEGSRRFVGCFPREIALPRLSVTRHHDATSYHGPHHEGTQVVKDWIRVSQEASRPLPKTEGKEVRRMHPEKYHKKQLCFKELPVALGTCFW